MNLHIWWALELYQIRTIEPCLETCEPNHEWETGLLGRVGKVGYLKRGNPEMESKGLISVMRNGWSEGFFAASIRLALVRTRVSCYLKERKTTKSVLLVKHKRERLLTGFSSSDVGLVPKSKQKPSSPLLRVLFSGSYCFLSANGHISSSSIRIKRMSQSNEPTNPNLDSRLTTEGCSVLLDINDGDRLVFARLSAAASVSLDFLYYCVW